ncbi:MAG: hypothetical protein DBY36_09820 [Clostridiales bacterium]|nr:MAG: hypothetical protein DBY36_09820 [Clostridiales bacterium]
MKNVFDITEFGAVGDGASDCTGAIQSAMDAAAAVKGCVLVPPGEYVCGGLKVPREITVEGFHSWSFRGCGGSVLLLRDAGDACLLDLSYAIGCTVKGLSLDGRGIGEGVHGILVTYGEYNGAGEEDSFRIEDCKVSHFSGDGVRLKHIWCFSVRHCMLAFNAGSGLYIDGWDGFVLDNWLTGNAGAGLYSDATCSSVTLTGNRIEWNRMAGISLRAAKCCNITGNYFDRSGGPALSVRGRGGDAVSDSLTVTGNIFNRSGAGDYGENAPQDAYDDAHVRMERCVNCVVTGNVCRAGRNDGGTGRLSPFYSFVFRQLRGCIIRDNTSQSGAVKQTVLDLGEHDDGVAIESNVGSPTERLDPWYPTLSRGE